MPNVRPLSAFFALSFATLTAGCGDSGSPAQQGTPGGSGGSGGQLTAGSSNGGSAGSSASGAAGSSAGSTAGGGVGGSGGTPEPVIPGGPDESIPADPGEQPFVHPLFTDHMVLQRDAHTPIWGWSKPADVVTLKIAGQTFTATADQYGRWLTRIGPFPADGMAYTLEISGPESVTFTDVKFGDVWLCSGQSNMEFAVNSSINGQAEIAGSADADLRFFRAERDTLGAPRQTFSKPGAKWNVVGPSNIGGFSAVCYFMVRELRKKLPTVPMGMIGAYWGGTNVEWWTSREKLATVEDFTKPLADLPADTGPNPTLTSLYNANIAPLLPYGLKGMAWYQGESNAGNPWQYQRLMPLMIEDWRARFRMGKLPFIQVQLANFKSNMNAPDGFDQNSGWAVLRESQLHTRLDDDKVGMAVIADVGNPTDIHPNDKQDVGLRLAASALHVAYEQDVVFEGPMFKSFTVQGNKLQITFDQTGGGLILGKKNGTNLDPVAVDAAGTLNGFALAGADGMWKVATAAIDAGGKTVTVQSADVATPVAVRYGWHDNPVCNLYNKEGLMASPFRSDLEYRVSVIDGNGGGIGPAGKMLTLTANAPPGNQHFVKWIGDVAGLADATQATTMITMPKQYVSVRATYAP